MSKDTNKQAAEKLFATTAHDVLYVNPKGEFFTTENIGALSLKPGQKLQKFERDQEVSEAANEDKVYEVNAKNTIAKIKEAATLEDLKAFEIDERKSVIEAYTKRLAELTEAIEVAVVIQVNGNDDTEGKK